MIYNTLVITCGVSLLTSGHYGEGPSLLDDNAKLAEWLRRWQHTRLTLHQADRERVSAEYSLVLATQRRKLLHRSPVIHLLHTPSPPGEGAVSLLKRLLTDDFGATVRTHTLPEIPVNDAARLQKSLGTYMSQISRILQGYEPRTTLFAPIGGYKVMTSLGYLAGAFQGFPSAYLYERSQVLHIIPAVPIQMSRDQLEEVAPTLRAVGTAAGVDTLTPIQQEHINDLFGWLFDREEELVSVNAIGHYLMNLPENIELFGTQICSHADLLPRDSGPRGFVLQQLGELAKKLLHGVRSDTLCHDWSDPSGDWHVYKGASNGQWVFRALYRYDENILHIDHLWLDHDRYAREAATIHPRSMDGATVWILEGES